MEERDKQGRLIIASYDPKAPARQIVSEDPNHSYVKAKREAEQQKNQENQTQTAQPIQPTQPNIYPVQRYNAAYDLNSKNVTPKKAAEIVKENPNLLYRFDPSYGLDLKTSLQQYGINSLIEVATTTNKNKDQEEVQHKAEIVTATNVQENQESYGTKFYKVDEKGLYAVDENGKLSLITNALVKIVKKELTIDKNGLYKELKFILKMYTPKTGTEAILTISAGNEFFGVYSKLHSDPNLFGKFEFYPDPKRSIKAINAYLHKVSAEAENMNIFLIYKSTGWYQRNNRFLYEVPTRDGRYYERRRNISQQEEEDIFSKGVKWLTLVNHPSRNILWLIAHCQFLRFFLSQCNVVEQFTTYVEGENGSGKTFTTRQIANPFLKNINRRFETLTSTQSALEGIIERYSDTILLFDDMTFNVGNERTMLLNAETIIRAVGDGRLRAKRIGTNYEDTRDVNVTSSVIMTGEKPLDPRHFQQSTINRVLSLHFDREIIGKIRSDQVLNSISVNFSNDTQILADYFNLFLNYIEVNQERIMTQIKSNREAWQAYWKNYFSNQEGEADKLFRLQNCAVYLSISAEIVSNFYQLYGYPLNVDNDIEKVIARNLQQKKEANFTLQFIKRLFENLNNKGLNVATTKDIFNNNKSAYIGYLKDDQIRFKPNFIQEIFNIMRRNQETITMTVEDLKTDLANREIIERGTGDKIIQHNEIRLNRSVAQNFAGVDDYSFDD